MVGLYLSHIRWYMLVMLCTKAQTTLLRFVVDLFVKHVNNKSNQWSLSLTVHICAKSWQLLVCAAKCCQYRQMLLPGEYTWWPALSMHAAHIWSSGCEAASCSPSALANITTLRPIPVSGISISNTTSPRAEGHLFAGNDQVINQYFWKGPTLGYSKQDFLKWGSGGLGSY